MGLSWASHSTLIYTSESVLCSTICAQSATRHNIHKTSCSLMATSLQRRPSSNSKKTAPPNRSTITFTLWRFNETINGNSCFFKLNSGMVQWREYSPGPGATCGLSLLLVLVPGARFSKDPIT